jgi:hypothetical protein
MSFDLKILDGDLVIGANGDLEKVQNTDKLIQDILKIAITPLGGNPFYPFYGSPISKNLVGSALSFTFSSSIASNQLKNSLETLQKLQKEQATFQAVSPYEMLAAVRNVSIERNQVDPRFFSIAIEALTKALSVVKTEFVFNGL